MKTRTLALVIGGLLVGAAAVWTVGTVVAQSPGPSAPHAPGIMGGSGGMMGGGPGSMMGGQGGGGMMGTFGTVTLPDGQAPTLNEIKQGIDQALIGAGYANLTVTEVMDFERNFYAIAAERDSGRAALELLVDKTTGAIFLEYGPAMMWNTTYGHMAGTGHMGGFGGMMGRGRTPAPAGQATVTPERARELAQRWLEANQPDTTVEDPVAFPGYYTLHTMRDGRTAGMLSVNAATGDVWYHTWHGTFIAETQ